MNYISYTLVDITNTEVLNQTEDTKKRNQQRNWESVIQVLNFRTKPVIEPPIMLFGNIANFKFGSYYTGGQNVWAFRFSVPESNLYSLNSDPCGLLHNDIDNVPILLQLNETANIPSSMFFLNPVTRNIYFELEHK